MSAELPEGQVSMSVDSLVRAMMRLAKKDKLLLPLLPAPPKLKPGWSLQGGIEMVRVCDGCAKLIYFYHANDEKGEVHFCASSYSTGERHRCPKHWMRQ